MGELKPLTYNSNLRKPLRPVRNYLNVCQSYTDKIKYKGKNES